MLDWLESAQLRQLCQAGLNKSEQRHALAQVICTFARSDANQPVIPIEASR
jgi:TnpA family transposase